MEEEDVERSEYIKIDVEGKDPAVWAKCKEGLIKMVTQIMETQVNAETGNTIADELKRAGSNAIEFANAKLLKPSIENEKLIAEIGLLLSTTAKSKAEARKIAAEAQSIELDNIIKKFKIALGAAKMIASMDNNPDAILFCKNMEGLIGQFSSSNLLENKQ